LATWNAWDASTRDLVDQYNVHGYEYEGGDRAGLYNAVAVQGGKVLRNSEWGDGDATGLRLANCWMLDFTFLHPRAMHYWQALDGFNWGLIEADVPGRQLQSVNPKYYVIAQFSRHIRPGMTLFDAGDASSASVVASDGATLVIISLNNGTASDSFSYDLSAWKVAAVTPISRWVTDCASAGQRYARFDDMSVGADGTFSISIGASQIQTFEIMLG
jgi:galactan endo-1,6-beta-galactosidase